MVNENSFYESELRVLFIRHGIELPNAELIKILAHMIGSRERIIADFQALISQLTQKYSSVDSDSDTLQDLYQLQNDAHDVIYKNQQMSKDI